MPVPTYRILAYFIPLQAATMLAFAWYSTRPPAPADAPLQSVDRIVVETAKHRLIAFSHGSVLHTYTVALGRASGAKEFQGDHKTPVGSYTVDGKNPHSRFHVALHLSYPNAIDRARAAVLHRDAGGDVEIHGLPPAFAFLGPLHHFTDWTNGCIALTNPEIDEIYPLVAIGTPVEVMP